MIDWSQPVNGWQVALAALVQVGAILLTALLTWALTRAAERRRGAEERKKDNAQSLEQYRRDLVEVAEILTETANKEGAFDAVKSRMYTRFIDRVVWIPEPSARVVDMWVRTALSRILGRMSYLSNEEKWNEYEIHKLRDQIGEIESRFDEFADGRIGPEWFNDEMKKSAIRVWHGRIGSLEEIQLTRWQSIRGIIRRFRTQLHDAWQLPIRRRDKAMQ